MVLPRRLLAACLAVLLAGASSCDEPATDSDAIRVPSGREIRLLEVVTNVPGAEGATARFRFVAPDLAAADVEAAAADMQALCDDYALPRSDGMVPQPEQIVISLSASDIPFGESAPDVVQFFEAYTVQDGACIWEVF